MLVLTIELLRNTTRYTTLAAPEERLWLPFVQILSERFNFR